MRQCFFLIPLFILGFFYITKQADNSDPIFPYAYDNKKSFEEREQACLEGISKKLYESYKDCEKLGLICKPEPTLTPEEVVNIANETPLLKTKEGYWRITYSLGIGLRVDHFPDHCIWNVQLHQGVDGGDLKPYAGELLSISDKTKEAFYSKTRETFNLE